MNKGISLIVLVLVIIVMTIIGTAIILSLSNINIASKAEGAVLKNDAKTLAQELAMGVASEKLDDTSFDIKEVYPEGTFDIGLIQTYIPDFPAKYTNKLGIYKGELRFSKASVTSEEYKWLNEVGIKSMPLNETTGDTTYTYTEENNVLTITGVKPEQYITDSENAKYFDPERDILVIPDTIDGKPVRIIGEDAFVHFADIKTVILPDGLIEIHGFGLCPSLTNIVIPYGVNNIEEAFMGSGLKSVNVPGSVKNITAAFKECESLSYVTLGGGVENMDIAFDGCEALTSISVPASVKSMQNTFYGCNNLNIIRIDKPRTEVESLPGYGGNFGVTNATIICNTDPNW